MLSPAKEKLFADRPPLCSTGQHLSMTATKYDPVGPTGNGELAKSQFSGYWLTANYDTIYTSEA